MYQLCRQFAALWPSGDGGDARDASSAPEPRSWQDQRDLTLGNGESRANVAAGYQGGSDRATSGNSLTSKQESNAGRRRRKSRVQVIQLACPWGTLDPVPPPNWSSRCSSVISSSQLRLRPKDAQCREPKPSFDGALVATVYPSGSTTPTPSDATTPPPSGDELWDHFQQTYMKRRRADDPQFDDCFDDPVSSTTLDDTHAHRRRRCLIDSDSVTPTKPTLPAQEERALVDEWRTREFPPSQITFRVGVYSSATGKRDGGAASMRRRPTLREIWHRLPGYAVPPLSATPEPQGMREHDEQEPPIVTALRKLNAKDDELRERLQRREREESEEADREAAARRADYQEL